MPDAVDFQLDADSETLEWLERHPAPGPRVIAYEVHRCCGGGKICQVSVRHPSRSDDPRDYVLGYLDNGSTVLIDRRAAKRLPSRFGLTVRGLGRFRHIDLVLEPDQWGDLLYT